MRHYIISRVTPLRLTYNQSSFLFRYLSLQTVKEETIQRIYRSVPILTSQSCFNSSLPGIK